MGDMSENRENILSNSGAGTSAKEFSHRVLFMVTLTNLNYKNNAFKNEALNRALNRALNEKEEKVLALIEENPHITQNEIKEQLKIARSHVQKIMKSLSDREIIARVGSKKSGYWKIK